MAKIQGLAVCKQPHGHSTNPATVYGHGGGRTCIRLFDTRTWVYDPRYETGRERDWDEEEQ